MADDIDMTQDREERLAAAQQRFTRYTPPVTREGRCDECGLHHERLAEVPDLEFPIKRLWACPQCREIREQGERQRTGRRGYSR